MNGRKFSTRADVAGAGGSRHRDKKKLETDARRDKQSRRGAQESGEPRKVRSKCAVIKTCVCVTCVFKTLVFLLNERLLCVLNAQSEIGNSIHKLQHKEATKQELKHLPAGCPSPRSSVRWDQGFAWFPARLSLSIRSF